MTAYDAIRNHDDAVKVSKELAVVAKFLNTNSDVRKSLSEQAGCLDIGARVEQAARLLDEYSSILSKALHSTEIKEVQL